jgi:hypothetical protein
MTIGVCFAGIALPQPRLHFDAAGMRIEEALRRQFGIREGLGKTAAIAKLLAEFMTSTRS